MSLVVSGTIGIDTVTTATGHATAVLGGSCTYFAAAASFFAPVRVLSVVGGDFPSEFMDVLGSFGGIDCAGLEVRQSAKTFAWAAKYSTNMNSRETLWTELGVMLDDPPRVPASYRDSKYLFLANMHPARQLQTIGHFPDRRLTVADTMDLWINTARRELDELIGAVDGLVLNYDEAEMLTGKANTVAAARSLLAHGPKFVVVKKGEHGCILAHGQGVVALPAYPAERVVDPTGAGDTFAAGLMGYLAAHESASDVAERGIAGLSFSTLRRALAYATVSASFTIEAFSLDRLKSLTRDEIDARYGEYVSMVRV